LIIRELRIARRRQRRRGSPFSTIRIWQSPLDGELDRCAAQVSQRSSPCCLSAPAPAIGARSNGSCRCCPRQSSEILRYSASYQEIYRDVSLRRHFQQLVPEGSWQSNRRGDPRLVVDLWPAHGGEHIERVSQSGGYRAQKSASSPPEARAAGIGIPVQTG